MMESLRQIVLAAGRALALLAVVAVALVPALPAHAHMHASQEAAGIGPAPHHDHARSDAAVAQAADQGDSQDLPRHAADCCFVCHVSVLPGALTVPPPVSQTVGHVRSASSLPPPDIRAERLPEPPRSFA